VINIGGTETVTIRELAGLVQSGLGLPRKPLRAQFIPYDEFPGRYQDVRERVPDTTKARRILGFEAKVTLAEGLAGTIAWHLQLRDAGVARLSS
jgi:nucleoside-diphosphate-sugar epimerase